MNIFTAAAIGLQLLLVVRGNDDLFMRNEYLIRANTQSLTHPTHAGSVVPEVRKRVGCYFIGISSERYGTFSPENIDASICTHLSYIHGAINNETYEIDLQPPAPKMKTTGKGDVPRLVKLKSENPDLKLTLHILYSEADWLSEEDSRSKVIRGAVKWLNESGFDGLDIPISFFEPDDTEKMADFLCEMKNEFDKHGFFVTTSLRGETNLPEEIIRKLARCSKYIVLQTIYIKGTTLRIAPMSDIKSCVDWYVERGLPRSKIVVVVLSVGVIFRLENLNDTGVGAAINGTGNDDHELMGGIGIHYKELLRKMNDSSLGWTIRRDHETKELYAFSSTGLWTSYEDTASIKYKAHYVMNEGLGGLDLVSMDYEDDEDLGGDGRFPLTRTIYNTFQNSGSSTNN